MLPRTLEELPPVLIVPEAAEVLRVHPQTIYLMIERKTLRAVRVGIGKRSIRIEREEIARIMREGSDAQYGCAHNCVPACPACRERAA